MKKILLIVLLIVQLLTFAQKPNFIIKGKVGHLNAPAQAELVFTVGDKKLRDTSALINGVFSFKGSVEMPEQGVVQGIIVFHHLGVGLSSSTKGNLESLRLFIEPCVITLNGDDSLKYAHISGSKVNDDKRIYDSLLKPVNDIALELSNKYRHATIAQRASKDFTDPISKKNDEKNVIRNQIMVKYIHDNPDSWLCFDALKSMGGSHPKVSFLEPLFNSLSDRLRHSSTGQEYISGLLNINNLKTGLVAPDFTLNDQNGKPVKLSDFRGKYLLLDFWASWCGPCRAENPNVVKAFNQYKDKNFTILSVSLDEDITKKAWLKAVKDDNLPWTQVRDDVKSKNAVKNLYSVKGIPDNFLISPDGKILTRTLRGENLFKKLSEILK